MKGSHLPLSLSYRFLLYFPRHNTVTKKPLSFPPSYVGKNPALPRYVFLSCESPLPLQGTRHIWHFWSPNVWRCFSTPSSSLQPQLGVLQFNSVLILSAQRRHQVPQGKGLSPTGLSPLLNFRHHHKPRLSACFWTTSCRLEVPMTPSLDFRCQLQVHILTCTSDQPTINQRFPDPLLKFN